MHIRVGVDHIGSYGSREPIVQLINLFTPSPQAELSKAMDDAFSPLGLSKPVKKRLKLAVVREQLTSEPGHETFGPQAVQEAFREAAANSDLFKRALKFSATKHGRGIHIDDGAIHIEIVDPGLRFEARAVAGDPNVVADVIRRACLAISKLNSEFGWMKRDNAITALDEDSTSLMESKFEFLWRGHDPAKRIGIFGRVLNAIDLPDFETAVRERSVNIDRLLKVRETRECREFRAFLNQVEDLDDASLRERTASLRARIGEAAQTTGGKTLRFLATTAIGVATGGLGGAAASAFDTFLLDKIFSRSGVVTFIGKQYSTIFSD